MKSEINSKKTLKISLAVIILISIITIEYFLIVTSVEETLDNIKTPDIIIETKFEKLTEKGLEFSVSVNIFNPNNCELEIDEFSLVVITDKNNNVGNFNIEGGTVKSEASSTFKSKGLISYEAFDAKVLTLTIDGDATLKIIDYNKTLSLSTNIEVIVPNIKDFVFLNETVNIEIPIQFKIKFRGLLVVAGFKIINPSEIPLFGKNLVCRIYRLDDNTKILLSEQQMETCEIPSETNIDVTTEILIPYRKFFFSGGFKLIPDNIILQIKGDLLIAGTKQGLPFSINAYVDPHIIRTLD